MTKFTKTEAKVLKLIAEGKRGFDTSRECAAVWRLAAKGHIEATSVVKRDGEYNTLTWGRRYGYHNRVGGYVRVSAPKIEAAVAKHGLETMLRAVEKDCA